MLLVLNTRWCTLSRDSLQSSETKEEPPKKVRKLKPSISTPTSVPAPTSLGSLSLYGEQLPERAVAGIPPAAKHTCAELKKVLANVREFKLENKVGNIATRRHLVMVFEGRMSWVAFRGGTTCTTETVQCDCRHQLRLQ